MSLHLYTCAPEKGRSYLNLKNISWMELVVIFSIVTLMIVTPSPMHARVTCWVNVYMLWLLQTSIVNTYLQHRESWCIHEKSGVRCVAYDKSLDKVKVMIIYVWFVLRMVPLPRDSGALLACGGEEDDSSASALVTNKAHKASTENIPPEDEWTLRAVNHNSELYFITEY